MALGPVCDAEICLHCPHRTVPVPAFLYVCLYVCAGVRVLRRPRPVPVLSAGFGHIRKADEAPARPLHRSLPECSGLCPRSPIAPPGPRERTHFSAPIRESRSGTRRPQRQCNGPERDSHGPHGGSNAGAQRTSGEGVEVEVGDLCIILVGAVPLCGVTEDAPAPKTAQRQCLCHQNTRREAGNAAMDVICQ